jgi:hypothetical protein
MKPHVWLLSKKVKPVANSPGMNITGPIWFIANPILGAIDGGSSDQTPMQSSTMF